MSAEDEALIRRNFTFGSATVPATNRYDFNRDGKVNSIDLVLARRSAAGGSLTLFTAPGGAGVASVAQASSGTVFGQSLIAPPPTTAVTATAVKQDSVLSSANTDLLGRA